MAIARKKTSTVDCKVRGRGTDHTGHLLRRESPSRARDSRVSM